MPAEFETPDVAYLLIVEAKHI